MSNVQQEDGDFDWKAVIDLLRNGKSAEIPCETERDYVRRKNQVTRRAEKKGIAVEVHRGEGFLRVEPRMEAGSNEVAEAPAGPALRGDRQQERQQRREALRAERGAERGQNG